MEWTCGLCVNEHSTPQPLLHVSASSLLLATADEAEMQPKGHVCRICWDAGSASNPLISPCGCKGTLEFIHGPCLAAWRQQCRAVGNTQHADHCAVCKERYTVQPEVFGRLRSAIIALARHATTLAPTKVSLWDVPRAVLLAHAGLHTATNGLQGASRGLSVGANLAKSLAALILAAAPHVSFLAALFPSLTQRIIYWFSIAAVSALAMEVLLAGAAGFAAGAVCCMGQALLNPISSAANLAAKGGSFVNNAVMFALSRADGLLKSGHSTVRY